jgi:ribosome-binding protein aMBF1 (putative translation factor)
LAHWTISQRTIHVVLGNKTTNFHHNKQISASSGTIASLIIAARKNAGLTQEQLAGMSGIHQYWIGRWERGRATPTASDWKRLAGVLNLPSKPHHYEANHATWNATPTSQKFSYTSQRLTGSKAE